MKIGRPRKFSANEMVYIAKNDDVELYRVVRASAKRDASNHIYFRIECDFDPSVRKTVRSDKLVYA